ncbi:FUSC family protein [Humidisolicoccus flavus]|uniref:FUSC family protein n=1 Tax=Humidisolicoccus flavus TaxID=3111414 RepID=UPI00325539F4
MAWIPSVRARTRTPWLMVVKTSVAVAAAWVLSILLLGVDLPIFAAIAAIVVVAPSINQSGAKALERSIGVIAGVALAFVAGFWLGTNSWTVLALIIIAVVICWLLKLAPMASNQVPISAMLMLALGIGQDPGPAVDRIIETVIGAVIAFIVNFAIVPPVQQRPAEASLGRLADRVANVYESVSKAISTPDWDDADRLLDDARALRGHISTARAQMVTFEESLQLNPRAPKLRERIAKDTELLFILSILTNRAIGMARTVADHADGNGTSDPMMQMIARELDRVAHDVRLLVHVHGAPTEATLETDAVPALTAPLIIPKPNPEHWVMIGALLEDVRQVRQSLSLGFPEAEEASS